MSFPFATITKTANPTTFNGVGQLITYTYFVENTSVININGVSIVDDRVTNILPTTLNFLSGNTGEFSGTYITTQSDVDNGFITNIAAAFAYTEPISLEGTATITYVPLPPFLNVVKYGPDSINRGDTIQYLILVSNTGGSPLTNVRIHDLVPGDLCVTSWFYIDQTQNVVLNTTSSINFVLPTLEAGANITIVICAEVSKCASNVITNIVEVTSKELPLVRAETSTDVLRNCNNDCGNRKHGHKYYF